MQAAMRDPSLTPPERQQRIREIMAGPAEAPAVAADSSGAATAVDGVTLTKQERVRAVMQDTALNPAERQKRIQAIMREITPVPTAAAQEDVDKEDRERLRQVCM